MKFITFVKQMFTSHSGISSKRVCGVMMNLQRMVLDGIGKIL